MEGLIGLCTQAFPNFPPSGSHILKFTVRASLLLTASAVVVPLRLYSIISVKERRLDPGVLRCSIPISIFRAESSDSNGEMSRQSTLQVTALFEAKGRTEIIQICPRSAVIGEASHVGARSELCRLLQHDCDELVAAARGDATGAQPLLLSAVGSISSFI